MNDLVSIVVPVYNVEEYLKRCVDSIINQTYKNIEIILVDDGSTDNSGKICDEYKLKDERIKLIHKSNGGLSDARNKGMEIATGKYITFIDSDDYISTFFVEQLYNDIIDTDCDISICDSKYIRELEIIEDEKEKSEIDVYSKEEALKLMLYQTKINNAAWGKLYKTSLFKNIEYPVGKIYEDVATTYKLFLNSDKICVNKVSYYYYTKRMTSISNVFNKKTFDILDNVNLMEEDLQKYEIYNKALKSRKINAEFFILRQLDKKIYEKEYKQIIADIKKDRFSVLCDFNVRLKTKLGILISYISFELVTYVYGKTSEFQINKKLN